MANSSNAYATERPLQTSITDWVAKQADMDLAYKQEKRLADAEAERKKDRDVADAEKAFNSSKLKYSLTNYTNHDEPLIAFIDGPGGLTEQNLEISKELQKNPNDVKLRLKQNNLNNSIERLNSLRKGVIDTTKVLDEGLASGTLSPYLNKGVKSSYDKLTGDIGYDYFLDQNGIVGIKRKNFVDENEDGIADTFTLEDLNNPDKMGSFKSKFSSKDWAKDAKTRYGTLDEKDKDPNNPYVTKETKGFNLENKTLLDDEVNKMFGTDYKSMTDIAKSFIADELNLDPSSYDENTFKSLKENYKASFIGSYDQTSKKTFDSADQNTDQARADKKAQDAIKNNQANRKLLLEEKKAADKVANDRAKNAIARAKAGQGSVVDDTPFTIDGTSAQSTFKGNEKINEKIVIRNGSIGFALQGDGLQRVIGIGDKAIVQQADGVFYDPKRKVLTIRASEINGFDDPKKKNIKPAQKYYGSNGESSRLFDFFKTRLNKKGEPYKNINEVIKEYDSAAKQKNITNKDPLGLGL